ncbi:uncharacterized protein ColSpa_00046 [Colletotrichum spaethianum]|uniref:Uncharacterized protein n=1 Tax=Colletotrichum spaethianum TaxID=700344 RepID=A0AA37L5K9_9PEZI|nr:uncharacterized protein ColSpa_00046 [Colletotrichum spaethianum]GKT39865.1 hypothetical protein ColSpa_00046 [Colletotrichum spaethianum]
MKKHNSAPYARLGQGPAPDAASGPLHNGNGTRSASSDRTATAPGLRPISENQAQLRTPAQADEGRCRALAAGK